MKITIFIISIHLETKQSTAINLKTKKNSVPANSSTFIYSIHPNYKSTKQPLVSLMSVKAKNQKT